MMSLSSLQAPVTLILILFGPTIVPRILGSFRSRPPSPPRPPTGRLAKLLIALHALYRIYELVWPPFSVFTTHGLPIYASHELLRRHLLPSPSSSHLPALLGQSSFTNEILLTKLASLDNRLLYARFGHRPLSSCAWCHTKTDYLMSAIAGIALPYWSTAVLLGILGLAGISGPTAGLRKAAWRSMGSWSLGILAISDVGARYFWDMRVIEGDALQLDALIHTLRSITLILLPVIYVLLPLPLSLTLSSLIPSLSNTTSTVRLTALARNAVLHDAALRESLVQSIREEQDLRDAAMKDPFVQANAERMGLQEGEIRGSARRWIEEGWNGLVRIGQAG